jgi:hypothetical protein
MQPPAHRHDVHAPFLREFGYFANNYQQYLAKNYGYRCHSNTGVRFPATT